MDFYLKTPSNPESLIMGRIYDAQFKDGVFNYSAKEFIVPARWDFKNGKPKTGIDNDSLVGRLNEISTDAADYMRDNRKTGFSRESLRDYLNGLVKKENLSLVETESLVQEYKDFLLIIKGTVEDRTYANYEISMRRFFDFMGANDWVKPHEFNFKMYSKYLAFLRERYTSNTTAKILKHFNRFIEYLENNKIPVGISSEEITYKETAVIQIAFEEDELLRIEKYKFKKDDGVVTFRPSFTSNYSVTKLNEGRWLFLLQCYTGVRISDLFRLFENIKGDYFEFETQKVKGIRIQLPILPAVRRIMKHLNGQLPIINEQDYRDLIKAIYRAVNPQATLEIRDTNSRLKHVAVWTEISSHDAVRTFITLCDEKGMTPKAIALMVGKSVDTINKHYLVKTVKRAQEELIAKWA